jgi:hypothetical protein
MFLIYRAISILLVVAIGVPSVGFAAGPPYRSNLGLNVHWALDGGGVDHLFEYRLRQSKTPWAREHMEAKVIMGENQQGWLNRYDLTLQRYKDNNIKVLAMLAYNPDGSFYAPDPKEWEEFLTLVVSRWHDHVDAWEVWNEPDTDHFLQIPNPIYYRQIIEPAYSIIKSIDPSATVVSGGLTYPNRWFADYMLTHYSHAFDAIGVHLYYCNDYFSRRGLSRLQEDLSKFGETLDRHAKQKRIWVTEIGCSTGKTGVNADEARAYYEAVMPVVWNSGDVDMVFPYVIRNRAYDDPYEDEFGLLDRAMNDRPAWGWYLNVYDGPYGRPALSGAEEAVRSQELYDELKAVFPNGDVPVKPGQDSWRRYLEARVYGAYPVSAIATDMKYPGTTVSATTHYFEWQNSSVYRAFIQKPLVPFAYGKARLPHGEEQRLALELKEKLKPFGERAAIPGHHWISMVNAYAYGGYPVEAIARFRGSGGKTVHTSIPFETWRNRPEFNDGMNLKL